MLKSYEAIVEDGQVKWLTEQPELKSARVIVTILEEAESPLTQSTLSVSSSDNAKPFLEDAVPVDKGVELLVNVDTKLEELGGSEPQAQSIPRRRYGI
jgi:hypothetical protein